MLPSATVLFAPVDDNAALDRSVIHMPIRPLCHDAVMYPRQFGFHLFQFLGHTPGTARGLSRIHVEIVEPNLASFELTATKKRVLISHHAVPGMECKAPRDKPRGIVVACHAFMQHGGRY